MFYSLLFFPQHFLLYLPPSFFLFLSQVHLLPVLSFFLLIFDHLLKRTVLQCFLLFLQFEKFFLFLFFLFHIVNFSLDLFLETHFLVLNITLYLFLKCHILLFGYHLLFFFLSLPLHLLLLIFHVSLPLRHNVLCPLFCFINLLPSLNENYVNRHFFK